MLSLFKGDCTLGPNGSDVPLTPGTPIGSSNYSTNEQRNEYKLFKESVGKFRVFCDPMGDNISRVPGIFCTHILTGPSIAAEQQVLTFMIDHQVITGSHYVIIVVCPLILVSPFWRCQYR